MGRQAYAGVHRAMLARRRLHGFQVLHVVGKNQAGHAAPLHGDPHGAVHHVARLKRRRDHVHEVMRHVLEQADQVYLLLIVAAQRAARLLAHDGHDGLMVQLGVVQPVKQVDGARPGRGQAHADLPREFGVGAGHEGRAFFVACLDEFQFLVFPKRADQAVDAIAGIAEHTLHAPFAQAGKNKIGNGFQVGAPCSRVWLDPSTGQWPYGTRKAEPGRAAIPIPAPSVSRRKHLALGLGRRNLLRCSQIYKRQQKRQQPPDPPWG
ncbi:hypothetical protein D3C72_916940 [compost metagenome]